MKIFCNNKACFFFLCLFLLGFNATISVTQRAAAQTAVVPPAPVAPDCGFVCDPIGTAFIIKTNLIAAFMDNLVASAQQVQIRLRNLVDDMVVAILVKLDDIELDTIDWWETMWTWDTQPALQRMVDQLTTVDAEDTRASAAADAALFQELLRQGMTEEEIWAHMETRAAMAHSGPGGKAILPMPAPNPDEGAGRAMAVNRTMRNLWQRRTFDAALNKKGSLGAAGAAYVERKRYEDYKDVFCDPDDNGGNNDCTGSADPKYFNADTLPSKFIYNMLTINMDDPKMVTTLDNLQMNMLGSPSADPIGEGALKSAQGQETFLDRRAYTAKYASVQSIVNLVTGWRMPGTRMGVQVEALRKEVGIPASAVSSNPSYRELVHAFTIDRFGSGTYEVDTNTMSPARVEMEKLQLNAFYLMQLRDYYELLERTALSLAVQVSLMADQVPASNAVSAVPLRP